MSGFSLFNVHQALAYAPAGVYRCTYNERKRNYNMTARTDIHRPSTPDFDPESYNYIGVIDLNPYEIRDADGHVEAVMDETNIDFDEVENLIKRGYQPAAHYGIGEITPDFIVDSIYEDMKNCGHCGSSLRFAAVMAHEQSMEFIVVGQDCLTNRFNEMSAADFKALRDAAKKAAQEAKKAEQRAALIAEHPELAGAAESGNSFIQDVMRKFYRYGELSDRQIAAVKTALVRDAERAEREAVWATEAETAADAPTGKVTVTGEILSLKSQESMFGSTLKMIVKTEAGWKLWVTVPNSIMGTDEGLSGKHVTLTATVTPSGDDPKFAFGKRPSKASLV